MIGDLELDAIDGAAEDGTVECRSVCGQFKAVKFERMTIHAGKGAMDRGALQTLSARGLTPALQGRRGTWT